MEGFQSEHEVEPLFLHVKRGSYDQDAPGRLPLEAFPTERRPREDQEPTVGTMYSGMGMSWRMFLGLLDC